MAWHKAALEEGMEMMNRILFYALVIGFACAILVFGHVVLPVMIAVIGSLALVVIRVFDLCAHKGIDIAGAVAAKHAANIGRPYKHGGKLI